MRSSKSDPASSSSPSSSSASFSPTPSSLSGSEQDNSSALLRAVLSVDESLSDSGVAAPVLGDLLQPSPDAFASPLSNTGPSPAHVFHRSVWQSSKGPSDVADLHSHADSVSADVMSTSPDMEEDEALLASADGGGGRRRLSAHSEEPLCARLLHKSGGRGCHHLLIGLLLFALVLFPLLLLLAGQLQLPSSSSSSVWSSFMRRWKGAAGSGKGDCATDGSEGTAGNDIVSRQFQALAGNYSSTFAAEKEAEIQRMTEEIEALHMNLKDAKAAAAAATAEVAAVFKTAASAASSAAGGAAQASSAELAKKEAEIQRMKDEVDSLRTKLKDTEAAAAAAVAASAAELAVAAASASSVAVAPASASLATQHFRRLNGRLYPECHYPKPAYPAISPTAAFPAQVFMASLNAACGALLSSPGGGSSCTYAIKDGLALGLYRHGGFIPGDLDGDVTVWLTRDSYLYDLSTRLPVLEKLLRWRLDEKDVAKHLSSEERAAEEVAVAKRTEHALDLGDSQQAGLTFLLTYFPQCVFKYQGMPDEIRQRLDRRGNTVCSYAVHKEYSWITVWHFGWAWDLGFGFHPVDEVEERSKCLCLLPFYSVEVLALEDTPDCAQAYLTKDYGESFRIMLPCNNANCPLVASVAMRAKRLFNQTVVAMPRWDSGIRRRWERLQPQQAGFTVAPPRSLVLPPLSLNLSSMLSLLRTHDVAELMTFDFSVLSPTEPTLLEPAADRQALLAQILHHRLLFHSGQFYRSWSQKDLQWLLRLHACAHEAEAVTSSGGEVKASDACKSLPALPSFASCREKEASKVDAAAIPVCEFWHTVLLLEGEVRRFRFAWVRSPRTKAVVVVHGLHTDAEVHRVIDAAAKASSKDNDEGDCKPIEGKDSISRGKPSGKFFIIYLSVDQMKAVLLRTPPAPVLAEGEEPERVFALDSWEELASAFWYWVLPNWFIRQLDAGYRPLWWPSAATEIDGGAGSKWTLDPPPTAAATDEADADLSGRAFESVPSAEALMTLPSASSADSAAPSCVSYTDAWSAMLLPFGGGGVHFDVYNTPVKSDVLLEHLWNYIDE